MVDWNPAANALFVQAVKISSLERRMTFLDEACAGDPTLRAEVDQLLKAHEEAGNFLETPLLGEQPTLDPEGEIGDGPPGASSPDCGEVALYFLEPCDVPGRLGKIGPYEVIEVVGFGGMGVVLRANDPKLNRTVAVKVMAPPFVANPTARKRFLREAQAIAAVTHPHVIAIHAVEQTEKTPYLVMEFIDGLSLEEKIDRCGHLEVKEILRIGAQIAAGLAAAHAHGLVHRDIKPSNILLENGVERVRITDFGLARAVDDVSVTRSGDVTGTPQYMSPEQARGQPVDHRSDLFSLGAVLYTMCTGRSPFRAETTVAVLRRVCDDVPRPIREVNPDIPEPLVSIIDRLLAKDPNERFQTAQEVSDLLMGYLAHLQDPTNVPPPEASSIRPAADRKTLDAGAAPGRRWPRRSLMLAATVLLAVGVSVATTEATGVTHLAAAVVRIVTGQGTLVVEVDDPQVSVTIDGEDLVIAGAGVQEIRLKPGRHQVRAAKGGQVVKQELVTIERGGRQVLKVALESPVVLVGDDDGYRRVCNRMAERLAFGETDIPVDELPHVCALGPQSGVATAQVLAWANLVLRSGRNKHTVQTLAWAHYRAGEFEQAVQLLHETMGMPQAAPESEVAFPLALAYHGLRRKDESRRWHQIGLRELHGAAPREADQPAPWGHWHWLNVNVWYREAKTVFESPEKPCP
jgi:serine/threonine protein kinase